MPGIRKLFSRRRSHLRLRYGLENNFLIPAFTFAEVLITLGIIGIVAAVTIPTLVTKYQEKQTVTRFKWIYSTLANAFTMAVAENGDPQTWDLNTPEDLAKILSKYMRVSEKCYYKKGCIPSDVKLVALTGEPRYSNLGTTKGYVKEKFNNGIALFYSSVHKGCNYSYIEAETGNQINVENDCGSLYAFISMNRTNKYGLDHFGFVVTPKGIFPSYHNWSDNYIKSNCNKRKQNTTLGTNGCTCGEWIRRWGNADYWYD